MMTAVAGCDAIKPSVNLDLTGDVTPKVVAAVAVGVVMVILAFAIGMRMLLTTLHETDRELEVGIRPLRFGTRQRTLGIQADLLATTALARLSDLEAALVSLVEASDTELESRGEHWFDFLCESLGAVLAVDRNYRFRIAIWTDDETDPVDLRGLAYFAFNRHDPKYEKLNRAESLAGWAVAHRTSHYAPDVSKCTLYQKRKTDPTYRSLFVVPLGPQHDPWAAMTVDAEPIDGIDEPRQALITRFGALATVGARIIAIRSSSSTRTSEP